MPGPLHARIREQLLQHRTALLGMLHRREYSHMQHLLNDVTSPYMRAPESYDRYRITPYTREVADEYGLEYINASFIPLHGEVFIACQSPRPAYEYLFKELIRRSKAWMVVCLAPESRYFEEEELLGRRIVEKDSRVFLTRSLYRMDGRTVHVIKCHVWADHSIIPPEDIQHIIEHTKAVASEGCRERWPVVVHCMAGVGRTGTYLAYKALSRMQPVTAGILIDLLIELRSYRPHMVQSVAQLKFLADHFLSAEPPGEPSRQAG